MTKPQQSYRSFLIRLWWAENAGRPVWRVEVEEPSSQRRWRFSSIAELFRFLLDQIEAEESGVEQ